RIGEVVGVDLDGPNQSLVDLGGDDVAQFVVRVRLTGLRDEQDWSLSPIDRPDSRVAVGRGGNGNGDRAEHDRHDGDPPMPENPKDPDQLHGAVTSIASRWTVSVPSHSWTARSRKPSFTP